MRASSHRLSEKPEGGFWVGSWECLEVCLGKLILLLLLDSQVGFLGKALMNA